MFRNISTLAIVSVIVGLFGCAETISTPHWVTNKVTIKNPALLKANVDYKLVAMTGCGAIGFDNKECDLSKGLSDSVTKSTGLKFNKNFEYSHVPGVAEVKLACIQIVEDGKITNRGPIEVEGVTVQLQKIETPVAFEGYCFSLVTPSKAYPKGVRVDLAPSEMVANSSSMSYGFILTTETTAVNITVIGNGKQLTEPKGFPINKGSAFSANDVPFDKDGKSIVRVSLLAGGTVNVISNCEADEQYKVYFSRRGEGTAKAVLMNTCDDDKLCVINRVDGSTELCGVDLNLIAPPVCTDADNDGYCVETGTANGGDCRDDRSDINPGATEVYGDGLDNDCNANTTDDANADDDNDGTLNGDDPAPQDPCIPSDTVDACLATIDVDGDGTSALDDSDDNDPCVPSNTVNACLATIDIDGDGYNAVTDPDDNDPCNPNTSANACLDITDNDGDGVTATVDPDDTDPCNPDPSDPLCTSTDVDNDGDGVTATVDPDDTDPCVPSNTVDACLATIDADGDGTSALIDSDDTDPCVPSTTVNACLAITDNDGDEVMADVDPDDTDACNPDPSDPLCVPPLTDPLPSGYSYGTMTYPTLSSGTFMCSQPGDGTTGTPVDLPHAWGQECVAGRQYAVNGNSVDYNIFYGGSAWAIAFGTQAEFDAAPDIWLNLGGVQCNVMQRAFVVPNNGVAGYHAAFKQVGDDTDSDGWCDTNCSITTIDGIVVCQ